jgi:predicted transposase YbfD/YdcC
MVDAGLFAQCFAAWMQDVARLRGQQQAAGALQHVALDGKSVQGAREAGAPTVPMHLVHAFLVQERGLLVGLVPCAGAPGEAPAAAALLHLLELSDTVVTGDANLLSCGVADTVIARGGHYVLALKGNRAQAHAQVAQLLCTADALLDEGSARRLSASRHDTGEERGHGRSERRRAWAFDVRRFAALHAYLPHAASVLALQRTRSPHEGCTGAASCEVHFYVSSLPPDAERLSGLVRAHWSVENLLHRQLDVVLHEDEARVGKGPGAENLATARRVALAALRADASFKASMPRRVRQAAHDDAYRTHLLTQVIS